MEYMISLGNVIRFFQVKEYCEDELLMGKGC